MNSPTNKPIRKVYMGWISSGVAAGVVAIIAWVLEFYGVKTPAEVQAAFVIVFMAAVPALTTYLTRNNPGDFDYRSKTPKKKDGK